MKNHGLLSGIIRSFMLLIVVVSAGADDYFDQITVFSEGRMTRFVKMPITVYISPMLRTDVYLSALRYAMREWEAASDGKIQFQESEVSAGADILVSWGSETRGVGLMETPDTPLGRAELTRFHATNFQAALSPDPIGVALNPDSIGVEIILALQDPGTRESLSQAALSRPESPKDLIAEEIQTVCSHEFGHAIGLWGHSPNPLDVSFFAATARHPTDRDRATLLKLYATPAGVSQHDVAIGVLKTQIEANPAAAPRNYYLLGTVYLDQGDTESAIASFKTCLELDATFHQAREQLLEVYQRKGRQQEAINLLEGMLDQEASPEGYNTLGVMHYQNGEIEKSVAGFQKALAMDPYYQPARNNLYQLFREQCLTALNAKAFQEAEIYLQKALHFKPHDADLYRLIGDGYGRTGDLKNAIVHYQKALHFEPTDRRTQQNLAYSWSNYGVQLTGTGQWEGAIVAYQKALELMPTLTVVQANLRDVLWRRANAHRESGHLDAAISAYQELLLFEKNAADVHSLLGELYLKKREYQKAIQGFQSALAAAPHDGQAIRNLVAAYHNYAHALDDQKRYHEAIEQLRLALALSPKQPNLRLSLATVYQHAGDFDRAKEELAQILEDEPQSLQVEDSRNGAERELVRLYIARGNALMNTGNYTAALAEFEAIKASAKNAGIYNTIGYLHLIKNQLIPAIAAFESALAIQPMDTVAYQNLLAIESQLDRQLSHDSDSQRLKNSLARVRNRLTVCHISRHEPSDALATYRAALDLAPTDPVVQSALIETGLHLAMTFQKKKLSHNMKAVVHWVQELDADDLTGKERVPKAVLK